MFVHLLRTLGIAVSLSLAAMSMASPVVEAAARLHETGLKVGAAPKTSPTLFNPTADKPAGNALINEYIEGERERATFRDIVKEVTASYEREAAKQGIRNDAASGLAFAMVVCLQFAEGIELDDAGATALTQQLQLTLDTPAVRGATDAQKQALYDKSMAAAGMALGLMLSAGEDEKAQAQMKPAISALLKILTGLEPGQAKLVNKRLTIPAKSTITPGSESTGGMAPGFTFSVPSGWQQQSGWYVHVTDRVGDVSRALVRIPPAIPARGNFSQALYEQWDIQIPKEGKGKAGGIIFRRYTGDGLPTHFVSGLVREPGRDVDTAFVLFLIDLKTHWQPVVVALTFDSDFKPGMGFNAPYEQAGAMVQAENFLATFRCPPARGGALVSMEALAGDYAFGSGASQNWVNVYTGATSMTFVSSGGDLNLKPNGTFTYRFVSASGAVGATVVRNAKGSGRWTIQGDTLVCTFTEYDQGDGYKVKEHRYRIAAVMQYPDGNKMAVLILNKEGPINPYTVGDSSNWFSTKKK